MLFCNDLEEEIYSPCHVIDIVWMLLRGNQSFQKPLGRATLLEIVDTTIFVFYGLPYFFLATSPTRI